MNNKTESEKFVEVVKDKTSRKSYIKVQYFTDIHEFITVVAVAKSIVENQGKYSLALATGHLIPVDQIVRVDDEVAPRYKDIMDFTCDC